MTQRPSLHLTKRQMRLLERLIYRPYENDEIARRAQILFLAGHGCNNSEIARRLGIVPNKYCSSLDSSLVASSGRA